MTKKNGSKRNGTKKTAPLAETTPSRGSDGRPYVTVYVKGEQFERLKKYCEDREIGISTFMRTAALEKVIAAERGK